MNVMNDLTDDRKKKVAEIASIISLADSVRRFLQRIVKHDLADDVFAKHVLLLDHLKNDNDDDAEDLDRWVESNRSQELLTAMETAFDILDAEDGILDIDMIRSRFLNTQARMFPEESDDSYALSA